VCFIGLLNIKWFDVLVFYNRILLLSSSQLEMLSLMSLTRQKDLGIDCSFLIRLM